MQPETQQSVWERPVFLLPPAPSPEATPHAHTHTHTHTHLLFTDGLLLSSHTFLSPLCFSPSAKMTHTATHIHIHQLMYTRYKHAFRSGLLIRTCAVHTHSLSLSSLSHTHKHTHTQSPSRSDTDVLKSPNLPSFLKAPCVKKNRRNKQDRKTLVTCNTCKTCVKGKRQKKHLTRSRG